MRTDLIQQHREECREYHSVRHTKYKPCMCGAARYYRYVPLLLRKYGCSCNSDNYKAVTTLNGAKIKWGIYCLSCRKLHPYFLCDNIYRCVVCSKRFIPTYPFDTKELCEDHNVPTASTRQRTFRSSKH